MAEVVGNIEIVATINSKGYDAGKKAIEKGNAELEGSADKTSKGFSSAWTGAIAGVTAALANKLMNSVTSLTGEMTDLYDASIKFPKVLTTMGATGGEASKAFNSMKKYADETIYSLDDMTSTFGSLYGIVGKDSGKLVTALGGVSSLAADAGQAMKSWSLQLTQMVAKPTVAWMDFKILLEQNPAAIAKIAQAMGKTTSQLVKDVNDSKVSTQDFLKALNDVGNDKSLQKAATSADSFSNSTGQLNASIASVGAEILKKVGPSIIGVMNAIANGLSVIASNKTAISFFINLAGVIIGAAVAMGVLNAVMAINPIVLVATAVAGLIAGIVTLGQKLGWWKALWDGITMAFNELKKAVQPVIDAFMTYLWPIIQKIGAFVGGIFKQAWDNITKAFNELRVALEPIMPLLKVIGTVILVAMVAPLLVLVATIAVVVSAIVGIVTAIAWVYGQVAGFVAKIVGVFNDMRASVSNIDWGQVGRDIIAGIGNGISSMGKWLAQKAVDAVNGAKDAIKNFFGIHSPSRVMRDEVGKMIGEGLAIGISSTSNIVTKSSIGLADDVMAGWDSPKAYASSGAFEDVSSNTSSYNIGTINLASDVDADRFLRRLTNDQEIVSSGLVPQQSYMGAN